MGTHHFVYLLELSRNLYRFIIVEHWAECCGFVQIHQCISWLRLCCWHCCWLACYLPFTYQPTTSYEWTLHNKTPMSKPLSHN